MENTKSDFKVEKFTEEELADGDPVVVYDPKSGECICLGTGFESFKALRDCLEAVVVHGRSNLLITEENAKWLEGKTNLHLFTAAGMFSEKDS